MAQATMSTAKETRGSVWAQIALLGLVPVGIGLLMLAAPRSDRPVPAAGVIDTSSVTRQRAILFRDLNDGTAEVVDATTGEVLIAMGHEEGGFVRSALRLLVVERRRLGADPAAAFNVTRWSTGRVSVEDKALGKTLEINAFGPTNAAAFAQLLAIGRVQP